MAEPLKNHFDADVPHTIAATLRAVYRPFLVRHPQATLTLLREWANDPAQSVAGYCGVRSFSRR